MTIRFYATRDVPYGCFSNFSPHGFFVDGVFWRTAEHYYQAQKYQYSTIKESVKNQYEKIQRALTPKLAAQFGRSRDIPMHPNWNEIKNTVMYFAVRQKFTTHQALKDILLSSEDEEIIEDSPTDYYWGCGKMQTGQNMLGKLLMQLREELKS